MWKLCYVKNIHFFKIKELYSEPTHLTFCTLFYFRPIFIKNTNYRWNSWENNFHFAYLPVIWTMRKKERSVLLDLKYGRGKKSYIFKVKYSISTILSLKKVSLLVWNCCCHTVIIHLPLFLCPITKIEPKLLPPLVT